VSLYGIDPKTIGAIEAHLTFISLFKCLELKFKNCFEILIQKFESSVAFISTSGILNPIVQAIKSKFHFKREEIFEKTEIFFGTLELDAS